MSQHEHHNEMRPTAADYSRFSSLLQDHSSIEQQQVSCREAAERDGYQIPPEMEFSDEAVSGTVLHRTGLDGLLAAAAAGLIRAVYFYSLSRLARELVISLPLLKTLVDVHKVRVVSIVDHVDSNDPNWELSAIFAGIQHGRYITELSASVFRGQTGNIRAGLSNGDYCLGFVGEPVPGSDQGRRGRNARPRMTYAIEPVAAEWVKQIFHWFVVERRAIRWIARELSQRGAPKGHRGRSKGWHHQVVTRLLQNVKYVGIWQWGTLKNVRNPLTGQISRQERDAKELEAYSRDLPQLRIIDQEQFERAQELLCGNRERRAARHRGDGKFSRQQTGQVHSAPRHLLAGLIRCGECGHTFYVGGSFGEYLFCPNYRAGICTCQTTLLRQRAEKLILEVVSKQILDNPVWFNNVLESTRQAWRVQLENLPNELSATEKSLAKIIERINNLLDHIEDGKASPDVEGRLSERKAEQKRLEAKLKKLRSSNDSLPQEPTPAWLTERIKDLSSTLYGAAPAAAFALRDLLGGKIVVHEVKTPGKKRHFLRGTFSLEGNCAGALGLPAEVAALASASGEAVELDFVDKNPLDAQAEEAKALWDQGLLNVDIARQLGCSKPQVTKLLKHWSKLHDVTLPSGYSRRSQIMQQDGPPALFQQIADEVMVLFQQEVLLGEIAEKLGCDASTVTKAIRFWHESRGLAVPDGRTRRRSLERKSSSPTRVLKDDDLGPAAA